MQNFLIFWGQCYINSYTETIGASKMAELANVIDDRKEEMKHPKGDQYVRNLLKPGMDDNKVFMQKQMDELILLTDNKALETMVEMKDGLIKG